MASSKNRVERRPMLESYLTQGQQPANNRFLKKAQEVQEDAEKSAAAAEAMEATSPVYEPAVESRSSLTDGSEGLPESEGSAPAAVIAAEPVARQEELPEDNPEATVVRKAKQREIAAKDAVLSDGDNWGLVTPRFKKENRSMNLMIRIRPSLKARVEARCTNYGVSISDAMDQLFEKWLSEPERKREN